VLKVSFLGPPRTGSPGQLRPLAGGAELSRKRPLTRRPAAKAHSSTTTLRSWRTTQIRNAICGKTRPVSWVIRVWTGGTEQLSIGCGQVGAQRGGYAASETR